MIAQTAKSRPGSYPIRGPLLLVRRLIHYLHHGTLILSTFALLVNVVSLHMALNDWPFDNPVAADKTSVLFVFRTAYHFKKAQFQEQVRLRPDLFSEAADRHLVYSQSPSNTCGRPALLQAPEYVPLLLRPQPGMAVLWPPLGWVTSEPFVQRWFGHTVPLFAYLNEVVGKTTGNVMCGNSTQIICEMQIKYLRFKAEGGYACDQANDSGVPSL